MSGNTRICLITNLQSEPPISRHFSPTLRGRPRRSGSSSACRLWGKQPEDERTAWATRDQHNRNWGTPRLEDIVKAATSISVPSKTTAPRTPRQEGIIKEAIGLTDVKTLRARARQGVEDGAMTAGYKAKVETVIKLLNEALATEIVCVLRYKRHYFMATGISSLSVKGEFLQHATEEQAHADQLAERIVQLGGEPNLSPEGMLNRSHSEYVEAESLVEMITEDLIAERIAIDSYREMVD